MACFALPILDSIFVKKGKINMVTMLDCIRRVPQRMEWMLNHLSEITRPMEEAFASRAAQWNEMVFIGCGSSNTAALTARYPAQRLAGIRVTPVLPDEFIDQQAVRNPNALYVFISHTGTSVLTRNALYEAKRLGYDTATVSEAVTTPIAQEVDAFWNQGCGPEEYPMHTLGFSTAALSLVLMGLWVGEKNGSLTPERKNAFFDDMRKTASQIGPVIDQTLTWLEKERRQMLMSDCLVFTGSGALCGIAMESAVKMWETPQLITLAYELEEGLHGANYGYTQRHCVIVLNDGGKDSQKARSLAAFMKNEKHNGYLIGAHPLDEHDLSFDCSSDLNWLVFAAVTQTMSYHLAVSLGRDLFAPHDNRVMYSYFDTHNEIGGKQHYNTAVPTLP